MTSNVHTHQTAKGRTWGIDDSSRFWVAPVEHDTVARAGRGARRLDRVRQRSHPAKDGVDNSLGRVSGPRWIRHAGERLRSRR